jgi:uncharacterized membrane protein YqhA
MSRDGVDHSGESAEGSPAAPKDLAARALVVIGAMMRLSVVAVIGALVGAILMFTIGVASTLDAISGYVQDQEGEQTAGDGLVAMTEVVAALDEFLFGLLLLVFAAGVYQLFLAPDLPRAEVRRQLPLWIHVTNLTQLKIRLVELVVVVLVVQFFRVVLIEFDDLDWSALVVPIAIAVFAGLIWVLDGVDGRSDDT